MLLRGYGVQRSESECVLWCRAGRCREGLGTLLGSFVARPTTRRNSTVQLQKVVHEGVRARG